MGYYTGMKFFADVLDIELPQVFAAFSFYSSNTNNQIVLPEKWSGRYVDETLVESTGSRSATGYLTSANSSFFAKSGSGIFNGNYSMALSGRDFSLNDSTLFLSYERAFGAPRNEILLTSATGNSFKDNVGYLLGVNDANKLYFKYWNPVEGDFTFTYSKILSDKNLIVLNRNNSVITMGKYNNNTYSFDTEEFLIYQNAFQNHPSGMLHLGGYNRIIGTSKPIQNWATYDTYNFVGYIDKFFFFSGISFQYSNLLASGIYSVATGFNGFNTTNCFTSGYLFNSGFYYTGITGIFVSGFTSGVGDGITGYITGASGYSYSGETGFRNDYIGSLFDSCGNETKLYDRISLSGLISGQNLYLEPLIGPIYITGAIEYPLTGNILGYTGIYITGTYCDDVFTSSGDIALDINLDYLRSLSYSEISLLSEVKSENDIVEIYYEPYQNTKLNYNKDLMYDNLLTQHFDSFNILDENKILLFSNGQALVNSGYNTFQSGYDTIILPNLDYTIQNNGIITNNKFNENDSFFYDSFSGNSSGLSLNNYAANTTIPNVNFNNCWIFYNGQKLISGIDYLNFNQLNFSTNTGDNYILIKQVKPSMVYISGNSGSFNLNQSGLNNGCSQVYFNGIKQKINNNYIENSKYDFISGTYREPFINSIIYNNTDDFFV
jgi:hypothetical protein